MTPIFAQRVAFGNSGKTDASPPTEGFDVVNLEFAGRPVGNAVLGRIATWRHVPVIAPEDHLAPAPWLAQLQRGTAPLAAKLAVGPGLDGQRVSTVPLAF